MRGWDAGRVIESGTWKNSAYLKTRLSQRDTMPDSSDLKQFDWPSLKSLVSGCLPCKIVGAPAYHSWLLPLKQGAPYSGAVDRCCSFLGLIPPPNKPAALANAPPEFE